MGSILPLADKIKALMKLKPPTNIKEVRHFLGLTGYYYIIICNYADIAYLLDYSTHKVQTFIWTLECQASFDILHFRLANTPIVQVPDPKKPYLLFTDASKFCYSGVLTQASIADSNETPMKILTSEVPFASVLNHKHRTFTFHPMSFIL